MEDLFTLFEKPKNPLNFNALRIEVARGREGIRLVFAGSQPF